MLAFIIDSTGRVEPATRTVLVVAGDSGFVKPTCDFLLGARFDWKGAHPARPAGIVPFSFNTFTLELGEKPKADGPRVVFDATEMRVSLLLMTTEERAKWFAARPSCTRFQKEQGRSRFLDSAAGMS
jgi:hypothetical protein